MEKVLKGRPQKKCGSWVNKNTNRGKGTRPWRTFFEFAEEKDLGGTLKGGLKRKRRKKGYGKSKGQRKLPCGGKPAKNSEGGLTTSSSMQTLKGRTPGKGGRERGGRKKYSLGGKKGEKEQSAAHKVSKKKKK